MNLIGILDPNTIVVAIFGRREDYEAAAGFLNSPPIRPYDRLTSMALAVRKADFSFLRETLPVPVAG